MAVKQLAVDENGEIVEQDIETMADGVEGGPLQGSEEQLSFELGSEYQLSDSTLKLGTVPMMHIEGQYQEGNRIKVELEIEIEHVAFPPVKHKGFRVGTERRHVGQVLGARQV